MSLLPPNKMKIPILIPVWDKLESILKRGLPQVGDLKASMQTGSHGDWLLCDGSAIPTARKDLITLVGANTPDWRGRAIVGAGTGSGLTDRTLNSIFGAETHTLTIAQMPSHAHIQKRGSGGTIGTGTYSSTFDQADLLTGSEGGGGSHNNMQPSRAANIFIYAGT